jgi:hypothetical protein
MFPKLLIVYLVLECHLLTNAVVTVGALLHTLCCSFLNQDYRVVIVLLCFVSPSLEKARHKADHVRRQESVDRGPHA